METSLKSALKITRGVVNASIMIHEQAEVVSCSLGALVTFILVGPSLRPPSPWLLPQRDALSSLAPRHGLESKAR